MNPLLRRPRRSVLILLLAALSVLAVTLAPGSADSRGAPSLRPGLGHRAADGGFVGFYVTRSGTKVYCLSPRRRVPDALSLSTVRRFPGASAATASAMAYALDRWGDARSADAAAVESQVLNTLAGNTADVRRRAAGLPARLHRIVAAHLAEARGRRGPYSVRVSAPVVGPGASATGSVRVTAAGGRPLTGVSVALTHGRNVVTPHWVRLGARGTASFRYSVTDVGTVRIRATALHLAPVTFRISHPRAGEQRMVSASRDTTATAATTFRRTPGGVTQRYECTTTCDGRPVLTLSACATASRLASRLDLRVGRRAVTLSFPAGARRSCRSLSVRAADGDRVTGAWRYRTAHGWSAAVAAAGTFTVDCPPPPKVGVTLAYDCARASVTAGLAQPGAGGSWTPFVNTSRHRMVLVVTGAGSRPVTVTATRGHEALWTTSMTCGSRRHLSVRAGVQRASGAWNYGPVAEVTTP